MRGCRGGRDDIENDRLTNITMQTLDAIAEALAVHPAELVKRKC